MIVLKSTLATVEAERDRLRAACAVASENERSMLGTIARLRGELEAANEESRERMNGWHGAIALADNINTQAKRLEAELAETWIRNKRGHFARHPTHPSHQATALPGAPSPEMLNSELNKDRSGKHGSEVA